MHRRAHLGQPRRTHGKYMRGELVVNVCSDCPAYCRGEPQTPNRVESGGSGRAGAAAVLVLLGTAAHRVAGVPIRCVFGRLVARRLPSFGRGKPDGERGRTPLRPAFYALERSSGPRVQQASWDRSGRMLAPHHQVHHRDDANENLSKRRLRLSKIEPAANQS